MRGKPLPDHPNPSSPSRRETNNRGHARPGHVARPDRLEDNRVSNHGRTNSFRSSSYIFSQPVIHYHSQIPSGKQVMSQMPCLPARDHRTSPFRILSSRALLALVTDGPAPAAPRPRAGSMVQTKARALKRAAEAAAKPPSKKKAKPVSEPLVKKKRKGKQARDRAKEAAKVSAAYLAAKAAGKGAAAPSEPTPTLRMRGLPFSATTDDINGTRPSDRTPD